MKKILILLTLVLIAASAYTLWPGQPPQGAAADIADDTVAGPFRIRVSLPDGTPTTGDNRLRIELKTLAGEVVTDAAIRAVAQMPEMPGMGAVEVADLSHAGDGVYEGTLSLTIAGDWVLAVDAETEAQGHGDRVLALTTGAAGLSPVSATPEGIAHYTCPMHFSVRSPEQVVARSAACSCSRSP